LIARSAPARRLRWLYPPRLPLKPACRGFVFLDMQKAGRYKPVSKIGGVQASEGLKGRT
jgi:hypothetical protein